MARKPAKPKLPAEPTTIAGLAEAIHVADRTLAGWLKRGCPKGPVEAIAQWRASRLEPKPDGGVEAGPLTRLKKRKLREDIRARKIRTDQLEEKMILKADAQAVFAELCLGIKTELERLPDAIEMDIPRQHRAALKKAFTHRINQALQRMSQWQI
jgi:hypothetical protein